MTLSASIHRAIALLHRQSEDWRGLGPAMLRAKWARRRGAQEIDVSFRGAGRVRLRPQDSDLEVFRQVFVDRQYALAGLPQCARLRTAYERCLADQVLPVIIDAGANVGAASIWFARQFPRAHVVAIEPDPTNARLCRFNTASLPNVQVLEGAMVGSPGSVEVVAMPQSWGFRTIRAGRGGVSGYTINEVMRGVPGARCLLIAKIDIEGFESDLFSDNIGWVDLATTIFVEPHDWAWPNGKTSASMQEALFGRGMELLIVKENLVLVKEGLDAPPWPEEEPEAAKR